MSASRHLNPNQLSMFMPAHAVAAMTLGDADDQSDRGKRRLLSQKHDENVTSAMSWYENRSRKEVFDTEGVKRPLEIAHVKHYENYYHNGERAQHVVEGTQLDEGHHRLAWAMNKDPKTELPVEHFSYGHD